MSNNHDSAEFDDHFIYDPALIEAGFGLKSLTQLIGDGVLGVARFFAIPSFEGESVFTLIYFVDEVILQSAVAKNSLSEPNPAKPWIQPKHSERRLSLSSLPSPLNQWQTLKDAALAAPTVHFAIINDREYGVLDGVCYIHRIQDSQTSFDAEWSDPHPKASNQVRQLALVNAYKQVLKDI